MANNYTEASFAIELSSQQELDWWKKKTTTETSDWELVVDDENPFGLVWFHGTSIDLEEVSIVIQDFLQECRPKSCFSFCWAETCSKPRLNEFGGGACFITADDMSWLHVDEWAYNHKQEFERKANMDT